MSEKVKIKSFNKKFEWKVFIKSFNTRPRVFYLSHFAPLQSYLCHPSETSLLMWDELIDTNLLNQIPTYLLPATARVPLRIILGLDHFVNLEFKTGKWDIFSIFLLIMFKNLQLGNRLKYRCRLWTLDIWCLQFMYSHISKFR